LGYVRRRPGGHSMATADDVRLVAVNAGVRSEEELNAAAEFWEIVLETELKDWNGQGRSRQAMVGRTGQSFFFNLRVRDESEPHYGHRAAFGIAVPDVDAFFERAVRAGALVHYPPTESGGQPRH